MKTKHTFAFTFILGLVWTGILFAFSAGPDPGVNGVFGVSNTCAQSGCHDTFALNSGTGSVTIGGLPTSWTPGQTYDLTVTVSLSGSSRYGFQFSAVNDTTNAQAGDLLAATSNDARVQFVTGGTNNLEYAEHTSQFFSPGTPFRFRWTAPASASFGTVRFNVAGNATNNDGTRFSDRIYATSQTRAAVSDTTAPVISSVTSSSLTSTGATITWTTDEASDSVVDYGTTTAYGSSSSNVSMVTSHSIALTNLAPSTTYNYRVRSTDAASNLATSGNFTFTTSAPADSSAPVISAVTSSGITTSSATITWTTNEGSDTQVEYGLTAAYGSSTALSISMVTSHSAGLTGLASNTTYHYRVKSRDALGNLATGTDNTFSTTFAVSNLGGVSRLSDTNQAYAYGYGRVVSSSGTTPSGLAIFGVSQGGVLVNEAGVPGQTLITAGRTYAEVSADGLLNTGLAIANPNSIPADITFTIRDADGNTIRTDTTTVLANRQLVGFLNGAPFNSGNGIQGSFSFTSSTPVAMIALRGYFNERSPSEFLMTTLPVLDLAVSASTGTQVIPHFAAGAGWTTYVLLVNPTGVDQTGSIQVLNSLGTAQTVVIDGVSASTATYTVKANTSRKITVTGSAGLVYGPIRVVPTGGGPAPVPLVVFSTKDGPITVSEAGVPVTQGTAFRMYAQLSPSPSIRPGIAIANGTSIGGSATLTLTSLDGATTLGTAGLAVPASGQAVAFLDEMIPSLAGQSVQGILRITTDLSSISVVGLRGRTNERGHFLMTTTPPTLENSFPTTAESLFPHLVNGGGWTTQFILFSGTTGQTSGGTLSFVNPDGTPMQLNIN